MTGRGRRPRRWRGLVGTSAVLARAGLRLRRAAAASGGHHDVTYVGVAGGKISFGTTESPTGCNPNTPAGDTPGTQTVLGARAAQPLRGRTARARRRPTRT